MDLFLRAFLPVIAGPYSQLRPSKIIVYTVSERGGLYEWVYQLCVVLISKVILLISGIV